MIKMNKKMKNIIKRNNIYNNTSEEIEILCNNILSKTKLINNCIIYDDDNSLNESKINFERILEFYGDWTGYEISCNEILLDKQIINKFNTLQFVENFKKKLLEKYGKKEFCIIFSIVDGNVVLRFHIYRKDEGLWTSIDLDDINEPILYDL